MNSVNWQRIEELFHEALQLEAAARAAFLSRECMGDEGLRKQVDSLIRESEDGNDFIDAPALSLGLKVIANGSAGSLVGQTISHYKIKRLLGEGGMGEVYLADDGRLERQVALKFLAPGLMGDEWAKEQLMREARAVARLENSNICAVHGIEQTDEHSFIVMQYVEGSTLSSLLRSGPLNLDRALNLAEQIVSALSAAHARGLIHRDIKPQNIMVTADEQVKVLDFGLAKFVQQQQEPGRADQSLTQTSQLGLIIGTVAYMSPEQTRGEVLDFRSDIFSFGIVLYEMLAGQNPFLRQSGPATIEAIKTDEPLSLTYFPGRPRDELMRILFKCLEKQPGRRFESTAQLLFTIQVQRQKHFERPDPAALQVRRLRKRQRVRLYSIAAISLFVLLLAGTVFVYSKLHAVQSLALMPITNQSGDARLDYLSEGLTRSLFDKFTYLPRLKVMAPTVLTARTGDQPNVINLGRELKVQAILSGEIVKRGDLARLHLKMLNTQDGSVMWDQEFDLTGADLFSLQNDITSKVTSSLGLWLFGSDRKHLTRRQTDNQDALNAYMQGRYYWSLKRDRENILTALKYFDQAIDLDPAFAKAYAGRSDCYALMPTVAYGPLPTREAMNKARYDARQAIDIDSSLAEAHTSLANIKLRYDWDWLQAEQEFKRAIELNPEYPPAHYGYTTLLALLGRFDESIRQGETARELDPYSPLAEMNYGRALYYAGRYDEAAAWFRSLLDKQPDYPQFLHMMGLVLIQQGEYGRATQLLEKLHAAQPLHAAAALGYLYGKMNRRDAALRMLRELEQFSKARPVPPHEEALVFLGMGNFDDAFELLERAYQERFPNLISLATDPIYHDLRADSRFTDLARRIGLPR